MHMNVSNIIFLFSTIVSVDGISQSKVLDLSAGIIWGGTHPVEHVRPIRIGIDTSRGGDTIKILPELYLRISQSGDTIEYLQFDKCFWDNNCSDDDYDFSGRYKEYYKSGQLKTSGNIVCNRKEGEWIYSDEDGNIVRYENYTSFEFTLGRRTPYLSGTYKEYFPNGQVKVGGIYRVVQKWMEVPTLNTENYEIVSKCCRWVTTSIKFGIWREYDSEGHLINQVDYQVDIDASSIYRDLPDSCLKN